MNNNDLDTLEPGMVKNGLCMHGNAADCFECGRGDTSDETREQIEGAQEMAAHYQGVDMSERPF